MIRGTTPAGLEDQRQIARWIRHMFDGVAPRYDLTNHVISFQLDRWWRWRVVRRLLPILRQPGVRAADLCCGSGDLLIALQRHTSAPLLGSDFSHPMLTTARRKLADRSLPSGLLEADALNLPLRDGSLDLVTAAFGFRNLADYSQGLREILRVLKPGGTVAILEFTTPPSSIVRLVYGFYFHRILPRIGGAISGSPDAYSYLPASVSKFPDADEFAAAMRTAGFTATRYHRMTFGIMAIHLAEKPRPPGA